MELTQYVYYLSTHSNTFITELGKIRIYLFFTKIHMDKLLKDQVQYNGIKTGRYNKKRNNKKLFYLLLISIF